jgi:hypothetical protein
VNYSTNSTATPRPALLLGYWLLGELSDTLVYVGVSIVTGAGLFVIWRERQLGLQRAREWPKAGH